MSESRFRVLDKNNKIVFEGTNSEVKERFNLSKASNLNQYSHYGMLLKGKYYVEKLGVPDHKYEELLNMQIILFERENRVVGYRKDVEKNVRDLKKHGINVKVIEKVQKGAKRRKEKYYILEKEES